MANKSITDKVSALTNTKKKLLIQLKEVKESISKLTKWNKKI